MNCSELVWNTLGTCLELLSNLFGTVWNWFGTCLELFLNLIETVWELFPDAVRTLLDRAWNLVGTVLTHFVKAICNCFGIASEACF